MLTKKIFPLQEIALRSMQKLWRNPEVGAWWEWTIQSMQKKLLIPQISYIYFQTTTLIPSLNENIHTHTSISFKAVLYLQHISCGVLHPSLPVRWQRGSAGRFFYGQQCSDPTTAQICSQNNILCILYYDNPKLREKKVCHARMSDKWR